MANLLIFEFELNYSLFHGVKSIEVENIECQINFRFVSYPLFSVLFRIHLLLGWIPVRHMTNLTIDCLSLQEVAFWWFEGDWILCWCKVPHYLVSYKGRTWRLKVVEGDIKKVCYSQIGPSDLNRSERSLRSLSSMRPDVLLMQESPLSL